MEYSLIVAIRQSSRLDFREEVRSWMANARCTHHLGFETSLTGSAVDLVALTAQFESTAAITRRPSGLTIVQCWVHFEAENGACGQDGVES